MPLARGKPYLYAAGEVIDMRSPAAICPELNQEELTKGVYKRQVTAGCRTGVRAVTAQLLLRDSVAVAVPEHMCLQTAQNTKHAAACCLSVILTAHI